MKIKYISIRNFRGIKQLDWKINGDLICLIGAGDSTKSTILDAIEYTLWPRWNMTFEDSDFHNLNVDSDIVIDVTVGELPEELLSEQKCGLYLRGWSCKDGLHDEPHKKDEIVVTISLQVSKDLEPKWLIRNDRLQDEKRISTGDRAILGMTRLGVYTGKHLSWAMGSILSGMTGENVKINNILAEVIRKIRNEIDLHALEDISKAVATADELAKNVGVAPKSELKAHVDLKRLTIKESGVSLHDGNVPLRLSGIGTQRLMGLALQLSLIKQGGINLIDEIEYGLEPHRVCQILKLLKRGLNGKGQIYLTTHSPCVLEELDISNLKLVFSKQGITSIKDFKDDSNESFQKLMRSNPSAFLAKRIIVCEGKTEQGVLRGIDTKWQRDNKQGMWSYGVVSVNGGGENSFNVAKQFNSLEYQVLWWGDSDVKNHDDAKKELKSAGIPLVEWADKTNLEGRIFFDLPWEGIKEIISLFEDLHGRQSTVDQVRSIDSNVSSNMGAWEDSQDIRKALGKTAHEKKWYKCISYAENVGDVVAKYLPNIKDSDLNKKINIIRSWIETGKHCSETSDSE